MKKIFITFGAGSFNITMASVRLKAAVERSAIFDEVIGYTEATFKSAHPDFYLLHRDFITANRRGWGYWIWKPLIILNALQGLAEGDLLLYADAGCEFGEIGAAGDVLKYTEEKGICFTNVFHDHPSYTKRLVLDQFLAIQSKFSCKMIQATCLCLRKSKESEALVAAWLGFLTSSNYMNVNDVMAGDEDAAFIEHRHDQSAFSLLVHQRDWEHHAQNRLWDSAFPQVRNRTGKGFHFAKACLELQKSRMLRIEDIHSISCTSPVTGLGARDILSLLQAPDKQYRKGTLLSQSTLKPSFSIFFKKPEFIERIMIHNSRGREADILPLRVYLIHDGGAEVELARIFYPFGGLYNLSPLIVELPLSRPAHGIGIQSLSENPTQLRISSLQIMLL